MRKPEKLILSLPAVLLVAAPILEAGRKSLDARPSHFARPAPQTARLDMREAEKFLRDYSDAVGPEALNFRAAFDRLYVPDVELRRALGRDALSRRLLQPCKDVGAEECDRILRKTIGAADFERYYYADQESKLLLRTFVVYGDAFEDAKKREAYDLTPEEEVMVEERARELVKRYEQDSATYSSPAKVIRGLEDVNAALRDHFLAVYRKHPLIGDYTDKLRREPDQDAGGKNTKTKTHIDERELIGPEGCAGAVCRSIRRYYDVNGFKVYRDPQTGLLKAFDYDLKIILF